MSSVKAITPTVCVKLGAGIKSSFYYGFQPIFTAFFFAIWFSYHEQYPSLLSLLIGVQCAFFALLEWRFLAKESWVLNRKEFLKDMFYQVGVNFLYGPIFTVMTAEFFIDYCGAILKSNHLDLWPTDFPLITKIIFALLVIEFFNYWFHRAEHRFPLFWRVHSLHHSPNKMGWTKQAINHPFEDLFLASISFLPAAILGAGATELEGAYLIYFITTIFAHSNLRLNHRVISWLLVTNKYHYRHHSPLLNEYMSNYGCALTIWDRIFGTFKGFHSCNEVGIERVKNLSLASELMLPFRKSLLGVSYKRD